MLARIPINFSEKLSWILPRCRALKDSSLAWLSPVYWIELPLAAEIAPSGSTSEPALIQKI